MPGRRTYWWMGLLLLWLLAGTGHAAASVSQDAEAAASGSEPVVIGGNSGAQRLEQAAEALYGYVLAGDLAKIRQESDKISQIVVSSSFEGMTSVEGIHALSAVIMDLKAEVASVQFSQERSEAAAAKLRLAANSLNHPRQPMWQQYYKLVREDLGKMEQSAAAGDQEGWRAALERLQSRYDNIRPAVIISSKPEVVSAFDTWLSYAAGVPAAAQPDRTRLLEIVSYGQEAARVMFGKEKDEPALSLPLSPQSYGIWGLLAAGFIISALVYTGFRKYRGENSEWKTV